MDQPNRLGRALGYFAEAYSYAKMRTAAPVQLSEYVAGTPVRRGFSTVLDYMAEQALYRFSAPPDLSDAMRLAVNSAWCYAGIKLIADRVAASESRPQVKKRVGEELQDVRNHAFEQLMEQPNSLMTTDFILQYTIFWLYLSGNAYLFVSTPAPGKGTPEEIWPLPADAITPIPESMHISALTGQQCIDYRYNIQERLFRLPGENMVHIRFPNPFDYWQGLSPLSALLDPIRTDKYQKQYMQGFFGKDNAIPTAVISLPAETSETDFDIAREAIREQFGQGRRSAIIRAGDMDVKTITQTLQQMELVSSRKFNREEIEYALGIPSGLISGGLSGDSRLAADIQFTRSSVQPVLDRIAAEFTLNIAPYYGKNVVIKSQNIVPQDKAMKIQEYAQYSQDRTINENRRELNLPMLEVGDPIFDLMLNVPTRLLPYVSSNSSVIGGSLNAAVNGEPDSTSNESGIANSDQAPQYNNTESTPGAGDMNGLSSPMNETEQQFARSASLIGVSAELQRWKKVAVKEVKEGKNPGDRAFKSPALPDDVIMFIRASLNGADEANVKRVFDFVLASFDTEALS